MRPEDLEELAGAVGRLLRGTRPAVLDAFARPPGAVRRKADRSVVTDLDLELEERLVDALLRLDPALGVLSEERGEVRRGRRTWVVDPLDGSFNFSRRVPLFASQLALLEGSTPLLAAVYEPLRDDLTHAVRGGGAWREGRRLAVADRAAADAVVLVDVSERGPFAEDPSLLLRLRREVYRIRAYGSAALHLRDVAAGVADGLLAGRGRPQPLHDVAPGALLVREAGGRATDPDGRDALEHRRTLVAAGPRLHAALLALLRDGREGEAGASRG